MKTGGTEAIRRDATPGVREAASQVPRRKARDGVARLVSYVTVLGAVSGCGMCEVLTDYGDPVDLRNVSVVGTWRSAPHRQLTFTDDGTFTATDLPREIFENAVLESFDPSRRIDGSGLWTLEAPFKASGRPRPEIRLDFRILADKAVRRSGPSLSALRQDDGVDRLFFFYSGGWFAYMK